MTGFCVRDIEIILDKLEAEGTVRRTGELRDGRPVYVLTEKGAKDAKKHGLGHDPLSP